MKKIINKYGVFYINDFGQYDREDGPAVELTYGTKAWYKNGEYHREDGPAVECAGGKKEYWYNDVKIYASSDKEWLDIVNSFR